MERHENVKKGNGTSPRAIQFEAPQSGPRLANATDASLYVGAMHGQQETVKPNARAPPPGLSPTGHLARRRHIRMQDGSSVRAMARGHKPRKGTTGSSPGSDAVHSGQRRASWAVDYSSAIVVHCCSPPRTFSPLPCFCNLSPVRYSSTLCSCSCENVTCCASRLSVRTTATTPLPIEAEVPASVDKMDPLEGLLSGSLVPQLTLVADNVVQPGLFLIRELLLRKLAR